jgi:hypothetical protein
MTAWGVAKPAVSIRPKIGGPNNEIPNILPQCFISGTKVDTAAGQQEIENLKVGSQVFSSDPESGNAVIADVIQITKHQVNQVLDILVGSEIITCTSEHPFWVIGKGWMEAETLRPDDLIITRQGTSISIKSVTSRDGVFTVYNLEVEGYHTYHVSRLGILVHNKSPRPRLFRENGSPVPFGFSSVDEYEAFARQLKGDLPDNIDVLFQGSSVTGKSFKSGLPFDAGRQSDFDIALAGQDLFEQAQSFGYRVKDGTRIGPLKPSQLEELGLSDLSRRLSVQANRPVEFMIFNSANSAYKRPSIPECH